MTNLAVVVGGGATAVEIAIVGGISAVVSRFRQMPNNSLDKKGRRPQRSISNSTNKQSHKLRAPKAKNCRRVGSVLNSLQDRIQNPDRMITPKLALAQGKDNKAGAAGAAVVD